MPDNRSELERLATIENKLDGIAEVIEAAVARGNKDIAETLGRHDERIITLKSRMDTLTTRLWEVACFLGGGLIAEFGWLWHNIANVGGQR